MNDWDLLDQHQRGEPAAIDLLVRKHINFVYSTARRLVSATEADDVVQAVFLLLTKKAADIPRRGSLTGWLYRTTRFCCSNLRRVEARRRRHELEAAMHAPPAPTPEFADAAWFEALDAALDRLSATDRDTVLLHYLQQRTFEETAQAIGITPEAARKRTGRALEKLRAHFARSGYAVPTIAAVGASLQTATRAAPAATINASLQAAHGKTGAAIAAFAHSTSHLMAAARLKAILITSAAAVLALTAGVSSLFALRASPTPAHAPPTAAKTPSQLADRVDPRAIFLSTLPQFHLDAEPSEDEARLALRIRLQLLSNIVARYYVHTDYPPPPGGWSAFLAATSPAGPGNSPPFSIDRPISTIYATGTTDSEKTISLLAGRARYQNTLTNAQHILPLPPDAREFISQTFISLPNLPVVPDFTPNPAPLTRLFFGPTGNVMVADTLDAGRLPDPDLETALLLRAPFNGTPNHQASAQMTPAIINAMKITFQDRNLAFASTTINRQPVTWSLDRSRGYAPIAFRYGTNSEIEMSMRNFEQSNTLAYPTNITTTYHATDSSGTARVWRTDMLSIASLQIYDPSNTEDLYQLASMPPPPAPEPHISGIEARLGSESFDAASVVGPLIAPPGSPSTAAPRADLYAQTHHAQFVKQAQQGHIDLLLLGDKSIEDWPAQTAAWQEYLAPHHAAAFGIAADRVENLLWRINHGELDGLAPKLIVLSIGSVDAGINGHIAYGAPAGGPGDSFTYSSRLREDSPDAIVAGIQTIIQALHEKSPTSKILLLGLCHAALNKNATPHFKDRAAAINSALAQLDNHTTLRYLDLSPTFLNPDGTLIDDLQNASDRATLYQTVYQHWAQTMDPLIKEMQSE